MVTSSELKIFLNFSILSIDSMSELVYYIHINKKIRRNPNGKKVHKKTDKRRIKRNAQ